MMFLRVSILALVALCACSGTDSIDHSDTDGGVDEEVEIDGRCRALCSDSDESCSADVTSCELVCQSRIAGVSSLCATCLLEGANGGACDGGGPCCPDPDFPSSPLDCSAVCTGESGAPFSGVHPVCEDLCASDDGSCSAQAGQCRDECSARVNGVSGLCATCLLEDANGGACDGGGPCCPDPNFPTGAADCLAFCGGAAW